MRTVIHLSEEEAKSFFNLVDQAAETAKFKEKKVSEILAEYMSGARGEEAIAIRFTSDN